MKMCATSTLTWLLYLQVTVLLPLSITCFDITKLLSQYPAYSTYSNYLTQTQLATQINTRQRITVLAVDNSGMAPISGKPMDVIKNVLSIHVILDYFDVQKFQHLANQTVTVVTLLQSNGLDSFIKVTDLTTGAVTFTSASDPNGTGANLVKAVAAQPYNISVVQISTVIMPPSLLASSNATASPAPAPVPVVSPVPVPVPVPTPVIVPVPVVSPVPVVAPVPVVSPVPIATPVPVVSPVPVMSPVPVVSPVPVAVPVAVPVPVLSPTTPGTAADNNNNGDGNKSGAMKCDHGSNAIAIFFTFFTIYVLLSRSLFIHD